MVSKKINLTWVISLFVIGFTMMILVGVNSVGIELTDIMVRICGAVDLVSLSVFAFSTVKKNEKQKIKF